MVYDFFVFFFDFVQNYQIINQYYEEWIIEVVRDYENGVGWCFGLIIKVDGLNRGIVVIGLVENWGKRKYKGKRGGY